MTTTHASLHLMLDGDTTADILVGHRIDTITGTAYVTADDVAHRLCLSGPPALVEAFCRRLHLAAVAAVDATWQPAPDTLAAARERLRDDHATIQHLVTEPSAG